VIFCIKFLVSHLQKAYLLSLPFDLLLEFVILLLELDMLFLELDILFLELDILFLEFVVSFLERGIHFLDARILLSEHIISPNPDDTQAYQTDINNTDAKPIQTH